ncbi:MAG: histidine kinase [Anaerolineae bacterium]
MDRPQVTAPRVRWYRRLQVQLWMWAILPVTLVLTAFAFTGARSHEIAMRDFVAERDVALAWLLGRHIDDALTRGLLPKDGTNLSTVIGDAHIGRRGVIYVLDGSGRILFHPDPEYLGRDLSGEPMVRTALAAISGTTDGRKPDGSPTLASYALIGVTGWRVIVEEPMADVIVPVLRFGSVIPTLVAIAGILSLIVIYFSLRTIVRPLQRLSDKATQITGGDLSGLHQDVGGVEEIRHLQNALRDMVDRIQHYQKSVRDYIEGITQAQETERVRLSHELHDGAVQTLVAIGLHAQMSQHSLEQGKTAPAIEDIQQIRALSLQTLDELRRTISVLRPVYLEELGFLPAIEALARETNDRGLRTELTVHGELRRLKPEVEMAAFRLTQEALNNALHHSQAQQVKLQVNLEEHEIILKIKDDGQGFVPPENPESLTESGHFGLVGMRERVLLLGGRLEIQSQPGQGTSIIAHLPL